MRARRADLTGVAVVRVTGISDVGLNAAGMSSETQAFCESFLGLNEIPRTGAATVVNVRGRVSRSARVETVDEAVFVESREFAWLSHEHRLHGIDLAPGIDPVILARADTGQLLSVIQWWLENDTQIPRQDLVDSLVAIRSSWIRTPQSKASKLS